MRTHTGGLSVEPQHSTTHTHTHTHTHTNTHHTHTHTHTQAPLAPPPAITKPLPALTTPPLQRFAPWGRSIARLDRWLLLQLPGRTRDRRPPRLFKPELAYLAEWWFRRGLLTNQVKKKSALLLYYCVSS